MEYCYLPDVVQVVPFEDYTVDVYFDDGKIVRYDAMPFLEDGSFSKLKDLQIFMNSCTIFFLPSAFTTSALLFFVFLAIYSIRLQVKKRSLSLRLSRPSVFLDCSIPFYLPACR